MTTSSTSLAKSLSDVRRELSGGPRAEAFASAFAKVYFSQAFGVLPKSEIDLLVFGLLVTNGIVDINGPIFSIARALNLTPAKTRNLIFQYQLRSLDDAEAEKTVLSAIASATYSVDASRLSFGIESPLARATIDGRLKAKGIFADISLSGEILKVPLAQFEVFIEVLLGDEKAKELKKALQKGGHLKDKSLGAVAKAYATKAGEGAAGAGGKMAFEGLFKGLKTWNDNGGVEGIVEFLSNIPLG